MTNRAALAQTKAEADAMGVPFHSLLAADLARYRRMADAAVPELTRWEWEALSYILDEETHRLISGDDSLPSLSHIDAALVEWADDAGDYRQIQNVETLRKSIAGWTTLTIAGVLFRLRPDGRIRPPDESREGQ